MDDYGEERDVGENVVHSIIRGNRMMPVIPPQPPPLPPISSVMNSGAMMWALSHTPGYEPSQPPASLRARYYETAVSRQSGPNIFCHMGTIDDKVITPMYEVDVVFLHGRHGAGKTTLIPVIAETLAQNYRDFAKGHGATELEMYDDPNGCSKFMIVVEDANTAATLRKHLAAIYPGVKVQCYFDVADASIDDHMQPIDVHNTGANSFPVASAKLPHVHGVIAPPYAAVEMMRKGFIGTVFLENAELYHRIKGFTDVVSAALTSMQSRLHRQKFGAATAPRRLGRLVILTADEKLDVWMSGLQNRISSSHFTVTTVHMRGSDDDPSPEKVANMCALFDHTAFPKLAHIQCSVDERNLMDSALFKPAVVIDRKTGGRWATGQPEFHRFEKMMVDDGTDKALDAVIPPSPNHAFIREEWEAVVFEVLKANVAEALRSGRTVRNILIVAPSPEQVSAIGSSLRNGRMADAFTVQGGDAAYYTTRMSFTWRFDSELFRSMFDPARSRRINSLSGPCPIKGRVVIATTDVSSAIEIPNLSSVIVPVSHRVHDRYKSNGLEEMVYRDIDGQLIRQLRSRLCRDGTIGTLYFAGTAQQLDQTWDVDNRLHECRAAEDMNIIREKCATRSEPPNRIIYDVSSKHYGLMITGDARGCGYIHDASSQYLGQSNVQAIGIRPCILPTFARLATLFPYLQPSTAAMLVIGVRCGVGRAAMALAALEAISDRIIQEVPAAPAGGMRGPDLPFMDMFQQAVMSGHCHATNGSVPPMNGYNSEAVAVAEYLSSFIDAYLWQQTDKDLEYRNAKMRAVVDSNFWSGSFSGPGKGWENTDPKVKNRMIRRLAFARLYDENVKDEGRQGFFAILRKINKSLRLAAVVPSDANCAKDPVYNDPRYALNRESPLLNGHGIALLSGIITMTSVRFAKFINDKKLRGDGVSLLSPRYRVHERITQHDAMRNPSKHLSAIVSGYSIWSPIGGDAKWIAYERTNARSSSKGGNFHSRVHSVKVNQIAAIGNIFTEGCRFMRDDEKGEVKMHLPVLAHLHPNKEMLFTMCEADAQAIEKGRDYLRGILYAALDKDYFMGHYSEFIISSWRRYDY